MNRNGLLVIEIAYDLVQIASSSQLEIAAPNVNFSQILQEFSISGDLFYIIIRPNPFGLFLRIDSMSITLYFMGKFFISRFAAIRGWKNK